jgi:5,10-methylene-tetrahydrofolate dehydrogenase/methenyl tetrahydrofolate cyclohydrolase
MAQFDRKNRGFYDSLTDEERKKFSNFLMIRWGSAVQGDPELQDYYVRSCNHYLNKRFFDINRHPKLQWLCATAVSPGLGEQRHAWIAPKKKEAGASGIRKQLAELYPHYKDDELDLMAQLNTKKDIDAYLKQAGQETKK